MNLTVGNGGHGILGHPVETPALMAFLRGQRVPQFRVELPKREFKHPEKLIGPVGSDSTLEIIVESSVGRVALSNVI